jgi:hypothetical protein
MAIKKWLVGQPRFYKNIRKEPDSEHVFVSEEDYIFEIPSRRIVTIPDNQRKFTNKLGVLWSEVLYSNEKGENILGWIMDGYLEDVLENANFKDFEVYIPHPTVDPTDPPQNMIWDGHRKTNMCGELCIAFIVGEDIETLLTNWKEKGKWKYYFSLVAQNRNNPLYDIHLRAILEVYGYRKVKPDLMQEAGSLVKYGDGLNDARNNRLVSPDRLKKNLVTHYLIARVIQNSSGDLVDHKSKGFGHWVVLDKITPYGAGRGKVEIYNPYFNKREEHSYIEFQKSCAPNYSGYWVNRTPPESEA